MALPRVLSRSRARHTSARSPACFEREGRGAEHYDGVVIGAATLGAHACSAEVHEATRELLARLDVDDYVAYVNAFMEDGRVRAGDGFQYADIVTVLCSASRLLRPESYLEIGVRRGRSMATVASQSPGCSLIGIDMWQANYAGMDNPGPDFVRAEVANVGHTGSLELISGDSHKEVPRLFAERPDLDFDLITVDGDHSRRGATRDLLDVLPRLRIGGALVFDDVRHPKLPRLHDVWQRTVTADRRYLTWEFEDVGYGVAVAVRRW